SRRRHTRFDCDWSSDVCSSDLGGRVEYVHDFAGHLVAARVAALPGAPSAEHRWTRDALSRVVQYRSPEGFETTYTYGVDSRWNRSEERRVGKEGGVRRLRGYEE